MITAPPTDRSSRSAEVRSSFRISADTSTGVTTLSRTLKRTLFASSGPLGSTNSYGPSRRVSGSFAPRPMKRFTLTIVSRGWPCASRRALWPTIALPRSS